MNNQNSNNLWEKLSNRHQQNKQNRIFSNNSNLYQHIINDNSQGQNNGVLGGTSAQDWQDGFNGIKNLYGAFGKNGTSGGVNPQISNAVDFEVNGIGSGSSSAITNAINGTGGSGNAITDAVGKEVGSGSAGGGWASNVPWAAIGQLAKTGYNTISGHDDKEYSDLEEGIIYPLQGAATGSMFGPVGAAAGALYGLGYSFKDDLGMKDSNFLTQMLFPIGMGDGGGIKIGGKSILDLG